MKSVFNLMFDYAVKYDVIKTNYARNFNLDKQTVIQKRKEKREISIFTNEERQDLPVTRRGDLTDEQWNRIYPYLSVSRDANMQDVSIDSSCCKAHQHRCKKGD